MPPLKDGIIYLKNEYANSLFKYNKLVLSTIKEVGDMVYIWYKDKIHACRIKEVLKTSHINNIYSVSVSNHHKSRIKKEKFNSDAEQVQNIYRVYVGKKLKLFDVIQVPLRNRYLVTSVYEKHTKYSIVELKPIK